MQYKQAL